MELKALLHQLRSKIENDVRELGEVSTKVLSRHLSLKIDAHFLKIPQVTYGDNAMNSQRNSTVYFVKDGYAFAVTYEWLGRYGVKVVLLYYIFDGEVTLAQDVLLDDDHVAKLSTVVMKLLTTLPAVKPSKQHSETDYQKAAIMLSKGTFSQQVDALIFLNILPEIVRNNMDELDPVNISNLAKLVCNAAGLSQPE